MGPKNALTVAIAAILAVLNNTFDEQTPACILAVPTKAAALPTCPVQRPLLHHGHDPQAAPTPTIALMSGESRGVSTLLGMLTDSTPCPDKGPTLHLEPTVTLNLPNSVSVSVSDA
jgi:hypothetical protein